MFNYDFSPETRAAILAERTESLRLYGLTDTWLAAALLQLARQAQKISPEHAPSDYSDNARLIYGFVPEICRRLGTVRLTMPEIDWEIREMNNYELREYAGRCILNVRESNLPGWVMLTRETANGNPVVYGLDRLCPGELGNRDDPITRRLTEIADARQKPYSGVWTFAMLD